MSKPHLQLLLLFATLLAPSLSASDLTITGQVRSQEGKPLPGALVTLYPLPDAQTSARLILEGRQPSPTTQSRTDASGSYTLTAPEPGQWTVRIQSERTLDQEYRLIPLFEPTRLPPLRMLRHRSLEVLVVSTSGEPIEAALVRVIQNGQVKDDWQEKEGWISAPRYGLTDAHGKLKLFLAPTETPQLAVSSPGSQPARFSIRGTGTQKVILTNTAQQTVSLLDADNNPLPGALVVDLERQPSCKK